VRSPSSSAVRACASTSSTDSPSSVPASSVSSLADTASATPRCLVVGDALRHHTKPTPWWVAWTLRALVKEGPPYTSSMQPISVSLGTDPNAAATLLKTDTVVDLVAMRVGLRADQLRAAIATQRVGQPNAKVNSTPLFAVIVSGPWKAKATHAANLACPAVRPHHGHIPASPAFGTTQGPRHGTDLPATSGGEGLRARAATNAWAEMRAIAGGAGGDTNHAGYDPRDAVLRSCRHLKSSPAAPSARVRGRHAGAMT
jgi:hypothetical protein